MAKYVRCTYCGKRIDLRDNMDAYTVKHYGHVFCDAFCLAEAYADDFDLTEEVAREMRLEIFDDEIRIKELRKKVKDTKRELLLMELELQGLENPFNA